MQKIYKIRTMSKPEVAATAFAWAAKEGWNPGLYDLESFYNTDPEGFFIGILDGEAIACLSAVAYDADYGYLGFYIVKPEYRGQGYGLELWKKALQHLPTQNIGLDGVVEQQENYKKSGFKTAYNNMRYQGICSKNSKKQNNVQEITEQDLVRILEYDKQVFPANRARFLKHWFRQPDSKALIYKESGIIKGYGCIRKCFEGYKIGPLFADETSIAETLLAELINYPKAGTAFFIDVPDKNPNAVELVKNKEMKFVFETARMFTKSAPNVNMDKTFGVTTLEIG